MFSRTRTAKSTQTSSVERLRAALDECDAVIVGAGAGLSTSAGYEYGGERFHENFADFETKYDFHDMYSGGFYPFPTEEERWAYWSRFIMLNRYTEPPKDTYSKLLRLLDSRDYFVLTTNVDHCFQRAGFDKHRLFYTQGDYGLWQCSKPCCDKTWDNEDVVRRMYAEQRDMRIPSGARAALPGLRRAHSYEPALGRHLCSGRGLVRRRRALLGLPAPPRGTACAVSGARRGHEHPVIIKYPFWRMTHENPKAVYACVNYGEAYAPREIAPRSICIDGDIDSVLRELLCDGKMQ